MGDWLKKRAKKAEKRPDVIVLYAVEGAGKTSFATNFRDPTFMMSGGETGLLHLMAKGLVPNVEFFPEFKTWEEISEATSECVASPDRPKTFVVDTINGVEELLAKSICDSHFSGDWGTTGFSSFDAGTKAMIPIWREWLAKLDLIRNAGSTVVLLAHCRAVNFKNPEGADFHRYVAESREKIWEATKKFADLISFLNFHTEVEKDGTKRTGKGGKTRVYHFERSAAFDAKHRHGLPARMLGKGTTEADFAEFCKLIVAGEKKPAK